MLNDFQIVMLASGSKGNAALISTAKQRFLVDIGISCRALTTRMKEIGVSVNELDGVFITHEHVDHVRGLAKGLEQIEAGQASILATIEPFVAAAVGVIFFAEALTPVKIIGMGLIFAAIAVLNIRRA